MNPSQPVNSVTADGSTGTKRKWTNAKGQTVEAELLGVAGGVVRLKMPDGKTHPFALEQFSLADQTYLQQFTAAPAPQTPKVSSKSQEPPGSSAATAPSRRSDAGAGQPLSGIETTNVNESTLAIGSSKRKIPVFGFSYLPILTDYVLRWIILGAWHAGTIGEWQFWACQFIGVPFVLFIVVFVVIHPLIKQRYDIPKSAQLEVKGTGWSILFVIFVVLSGSYITTTHFANATFWANLARFVSVFCVYGFYTLVLYMGSPRYSRGRRERRAKDMSARRSAAADPVDRHDIHLVRMETEVKYCSQRVDAYTLESALFGALSFSAFLALLASDKPVLEYAKSLFTNLSTAFPTEIWGRLRVLLTGEVITEQNLIAAVLLETLICSMFFLAVIVARIRFNAILQMADCIITTARSYSRKEEEIHNLKYTQVEGRDSQVQKRLEYLYPRTDRAMVSAKRLLRELSGIASYMRVFRTLGIGGFVLILVTAAFMVSKALGLLFVGLYLVSHVYSMLDSLARTWRLNRIPFVQKLIQKHPTRSNKNSPPRNQTVEPQS